jgi:DNA-binding transcriptional ArsR family regulator
MSGLRRDQTRLEGGQEILIVTDPAVIRVVTDPLRLRIFEFLRDRPATVKELATALKTPVTRLYYHVNLLEKHQIIRVSATRVVSGITEKTYVAAGDRISVDRSLFSSDGPAIEEGADAFVTVVLDGAKAEIRRGIAAGRIDPSNNEPSDGGMLLGRNWFRLTPERMAALMRRLDELNEEFGGSRSFEVEPSSEETAYEMVIGVYPIDGSKSSSPANDDA